MQTSFLKEGSLNKKEHGASFLVTCFEEFFGKYFTFVILL